MSEEIVVAEEPSTDLVVHGGAELVRASDPIEFVEKSRQIAVALVDVVDKQKLFSVISGRKHPRVEAWTFLGSMMGAFGSAVFPVCVWTKEIVDAEGKNVGWEARVEARTGEGAVVGAAEAMCTRRESTWKNRDDYAIRSMAQTRATSKALRQPLGFLMQLAGYDPAPSEEMETVPAQDEPPMSEQELATLADALQTAASLDPNIWGMESVLASASRKFGRRITALEQLTKREGAIIWEGAEKWLSAQEEQQT